MANRIQHYSGEAIDITYDGVRCIHAAECVRGLPAVFDSRERPWVQPDDAPADEVVRVILRCPSGALHFIRKDGGAQEPIPDQNRLLPVPDGPLYVRGDIHIVNQDGSELLVDTRVSLCRCGRSRHKPFCDNSHMQAGFEADGHFEGNSDTVREVAAHEPLTIKPRRNGPYILRGDFELLSADGETIYRGTATTLCRCGHSQNKPFCDNSHRRAGFEAE